MGLNSRCGRHKPARVRPPVADRGKGGFQGSCRSLTRGSWRAVTCCASLKLRSWRDESCGTERDEKSLSHNPRPLSSSAKAGVQDNAYKKVWANHKIYSFAFRDNDGDFNREFLSSSWPCHQVGNATSHRCRDLNFMIQNQENIKPRALSTSKSCQQCRFLWGSTAR